MGRNTLAAGATVLALVGGGVDLALYEAAAPIEARDVPIAGEMVNVRQEDTVVKANLPWKGEEGLTVKYDLAPSLAERLRDGKPKRIITETTDFGEGGFKIDILLFEKPDTNRFCYQIEGAENYEFFYQPPLTQEEIDEGSHRPPEIEGSYAVYHKSLRNNEYKTGKHSHIPRPQVWELGKEDAPVWADLSYSDGELCVTAPQDFLDTADYSNGVRIDPTFGYDSIGASYVGVSNQRGHRGIQIAGPYTPSSLYAAYTSTTSTSTPVRGYLYASSTRALVQEGTLTEIPSPITSSWVELPLGYTGNLPVDYYTIFTASQIKTDMGLHFDTGAAGVGTEASISWPTTPNPYSGLSFSTRNYSLYLDTTEPAAGEVAVVTYATSSYHSWTAPAGVTKIDVAAWGGGGGGGVISTSGGGGGGAGAFASSTITVTPGQSYTIFVGAGGAEDTAGRAGTSSFATTTVAAQGGSGTTDATAGAAGLAASSIGMVKNNGGAGGTGNTTGDVGGGGGGAGGFNGAGVAGTNASSSQGGPGGAGNAGLGGAGGAGGNAAVGGAGTANSLGGGGGGGGDDGLRGGACGAPGAGSGGGEVTGAGAGCNGQVVITYTVPDPSDPSISLVAYTASSSAGAVTTNSIDTTGADLIVIGLAADDGYNTTPTDSKSNTWTQVTNTYTQGNVRVRMWYTTPSSVGSGHTFSFSGSPLGTMFVAAFEDANQSSPADQQNGANAFASSLATGSITPTEDNELIIGLYGINSTGVPMSVDNGMIEINEVDFLAGNYYGGMMAYKVQTTAAAINPTFTRTNSNGQAATVVSFKRAAAAAATSTSTPQVIFFE